MGARFVLLVGAFAAGAMVSAASASEPEGAWRDSGAPLPATGAFVPSPPGQAADGPDPLQALASYHETGGAGIFDEVRLGVLGFWQDNSSSEEGVYVTAQVLFDPFLQPFDNIILDVLLRPRPHIGGTASFDGTDQLFAGLTWTVPIWRGFFAEASLGGTIHNGPLDNAQVALGCRVLFRESLGLGVEIGEHWRVIAGIDHSSHADLCDGDNDGLTHVGVSAGYRF